MAVTLSSAGKSLVSTVTNFPNRNGAYSAICWVNTSVWTGGAACSIVGAYLSGTTGIQMGTRGGGSVDIWTWGGTMEISSSTFFTPINATWVHIGYTYDGTTHSLYINGILITTTTSAVIAGVMTSIYINGYPTGGTAETSNTLVDDVLFYNRALPIGEIQTIYISRGCDGITNGLIARYCFNELTPGVGVITAVDTSGNGNNLIQTGTGVDSVYSTGISDMDLKPIIG